MSDSTTRRTIKKKTPKKPNFAFIDNENVNMGVKKQGWKLDWAKFRSWLTDKYNVEKAYMFMGYIAEYQNMYDFFESLGYVLVFKHVNPNPRIPNKGNIDTELVLQAMIDYPEYHQALIISGDGDFACLIQYLRQQKKLARLVVPNDSRYSTQLNEAVGKSKILSLTQMRSQLEYFPEDKSAKVEEEDESGEKFWW